MSHPPLDETVFTPGDDPRGRRFGRFVLKGSLGSGGMGTVYHAEDETLSREVVVKLLSLGLATDTEAKSRILKEARAAASLESSYIVPILEAGVESGTPYIVMPFIEGTTLYNHIESLKGTGSRLQIGDVLRVGKEIALGLQVAHNGGLIHRDIKPSNVFLKKPKLTVMLLDFGIAIEQKPDHRMTIEGVVLGTPKYMAPEQASESKKTGSTVDHRADLWSLGVVLYELLTGDLPFKGETTTALLAQIASTNHVSVGTLIKDVPAALSDLIDRLLAKEPDGRPGTAAEVVKEIERIEAELAQLSPRSNPKHAPRLAQLRQINWRLLATVGLSVLLAVICAVYFLRPTPPQPPPPPPPPLPTQWISSEATGRMKFIRIKAGTFMMGEDVIPAMGGYDAASPRHKVTITKDFFIAIHEVTLGHFRRFIEDDKHEADPRVFMPGFVQDDNHPVVYVNYNDADRFAKWLSSKDGVRYRLPTEAEWEFACRAGTETMFSFGDAWKDFEPYANCHTRENGTRPVGKMKENPAGLFDMHGNVREWCSDWSVAPYTSNKEVVDPTGPLNPPSKDQRYRIHRGGSFGLPVHESRSAYRGGVDESMRFNDLGFRLVAEVK